MKLFTSQQIAQIDAFTIKKEDIREVDLMERASRALSHWIINNVSTQRQIIFFAGPGNNGGDALACARMLANKDYNVKLYLLDFGKPLKGAPDFNLRRLTQWGAVEVVKLSHISQISDISPKDVIIDGMFGTGLDRPIEGLAAQVVQIINQSAAFVISIDIPSGLAGENNGPFLNAPIVQAHITLTFQFPKLVFMLYDSEPYVGEWKVIPIGLHSEIINELETPYHLVDEKKIGSMLMLRPKFSHKGTFGHALLIAGSYGMMGAAVLATQSCLRTGAGLVTSHVPHSGYQVLQNTIPEALLSIDRSDLMFTEFPDLTKYNAIGIGPGLGVNINSQRAFEKLIYTNQDTPMVIDADGINILSQHPSLLELLPSGTILTPHPKEFDRLVGKCQTGYHRLMKQIELSRELNLIIVLKGAHSSVTFPNKQVWFNCSGNQGMATAGSGDVLTGMILSLLTQGYTPEYAALIGTYLHGKAGDLAIETESYESLIASDIIKQIGAAFRSFK